MNCLPADWELNAIPFGFQDRSDPDRTIAQWIAAGAAPAYEKARARLADVRDRPIGDAARAKLTEVMGRYAADSPEYAAIAKRLSEKL